MSPDTHLVPSRKQTRLSRHAEHRKRQRSIPPAIVDALLDFGARASAGDGAEVCSFDKRSWRSLAAYYGHDVRHFERYRNAYLIAASDGTVVTVAWRH